jgi:hypothetical protein
MLYEHINHSNLIRWTRSAIDCLNNHCICENCHLKDIVHNCRMKRTVLELYRRYGRPEEYEEPLIEVWQNINFVVK